LHQYEIEKIENLDKYCRHIQIVLFQNNIIERLENLHKLKELKYLNVALNNVSKIENLESCESLYKLDLTCNFIELWDLEESLYNLKKVASIREIYMTGNPCTE
jgi:protein TilB